MQSALATQVVGRGPPASGRTPEGEDPVALCHRALATGSRSFALATRLLPRRGADCAAILYAWCRRADDAVDLCPPPQAARAVERLRGELRLVYAGAPLVDPTLAAFAAVVAAQGIPRDYPVSLLDGLASDAAGAGYATLDDLHRYCFQVASTVGLMMSHVFGVRDERALRHAAHLGIAMQLTNICRDVAEDWERGRLYLPDELCAEVGAVDLRRRLGEPTEALPRQAIARAVARLLAHADRFYQSGDQGIAALPFRAGLAVRVARHLYARIGAELGSRGHDALRGRVVVPPRTKLALALAASFRQLLIVPGLAARRLAGRLPPPAAPASLLRFPEDVLPL